ncbi:MAG: hypothetical protein ACP5GH_03645 [Nitrososphaeria archaeon]
MIGLALRPGVLASSEILRISEEIDADYYFIPDVLQSTDPIELSLAILLKNRRAAAGPGVIRINEHQLGPLIRRIKTISELSGGRFFLGVGLGSVEGNLKQMIDEMEQNVRAVREEAGVRVLVASLREGLARRFRDVSDGIILNFSTFDNARRISEVYRAPGKLVVSYYKVFIADSDTEARAMAAAELLRYSELPQYAALFRKEGIQDELAMLYGRREEALLHLQAKGVIAMNPGRDLIYSAVELFSRNGVDVIAVYPYFPSGWSAERKLSALKAII